MPSNTPLVSVCIAAYNVEKYIDETIASVLNQTYSPIELIIVNDGSTDGTAEVLRRYEKEERIRIINSDNKGPCGASNLAFHHSKGDYIKFFDADDILNGGHIEAQMARLQENRLSGRCELPFELLAQGEAQFGITQLLMGARQNLADGQLLELGAQGFRQAAAERMQRHPDHV